MIAIDFVKSEWILLQSKAANNERHEEQHTGHPVRMTCVLLQSTDAIVDRTIHLDVGIRSQEPRDGS